MSIVTDFENLFGTVDQSTVKPDGTFVPDASSSDGIIRTDEQCAEWAKQIGCTVVFAKEDELFIDIDTEHQFLVFQNNIKLLKTHFFVKDVVVRPSKQGLPHRHIIVTMQCMKLMTRIALQAALGSDPMRELLSVRRALNDEPNVVIFFEKR